jgi:hypothetical protein
LSNPAFLKSKADLKDYLCRPGTGPPHSRLRPEASNAMQA